MYQSAPLLQKYTDILSPYVRDDVKEIAINKPCEVCLESRKGEWSYRHDPKLTLTTLMGMVRFMASITGQRFDERHPVLSFKLPEGHRVQVVSGPFTASHFAMSIRLHTKEPISLNRFKMTAEAMKDITDAVKERKTLLISGGTGTGKTSFLNGLIPLIAEDERIVTIEGVSELFVPHRNWCPLYYSENSSTTAKQAAHQLLNTALRLRPSRLILGEIRQENAMTFCTAINTGHEGSLATIHANSPEKAIDSLINRLIINGDAASESAPVIKRQLEEDIYGVVQLTREKSSFRANFKSCGEEKT